MRRWNIQLNAFAPADDSVTWESSPDGRYRVSTSAGGGHVEWRGAPGTFGGASSNEAKYLIMDVYHESHDTLVIALEFSVREDSEPNDRIRISFGVLPGLQTRICCPLAALHSETLFLKRYPGILQVGLRGGAGIRAEEVNKVAIGTPKSVCERSFLISDVYLSDSEPEFPKPHVPFTDELGQYLRRDWPGKTGGPGELTAFLQGERDREEDSPFYPEQWGRFGGWKGLKFEGTGYFRTQHDGKRWWLVDPEGYTFISTGFDCVHPGAETRVDITGHLLSWLPEQEGEFADAWESHGAAPGTYFNFAVANLIRAFGCEWWESWARMTKRRLREWGFNTVANWSDRRFIRHSGMPYVWPLWRFPSTEKLIFRDFPDVFSEEYRQGAEEFAKELEAFKDDPLLIGYFLRNEPGWAFVDNLNITEKMLEHPEPFASKYRFIEFIRERYEGSVEAWNAAWRTGFDGFRRLLEPIREASSLSPEAAADLHEFNRLMVEAYVDIPAAECKKVDPYHLNLGMRYAWISSDLLMAGSRHLDVFSINTYQLKPDEKVIRQIADATGLPVMIGEFHHGAADAGMLANGISGVATQEERGNAYKYFVENGVALPDLVGMHYFILNDQALLGRFDGENYQIGAVDVCHRPYEAFIRGVVETHAGMYEVAAGTRAPYAEVPKEIPRTGF